MHLEFPEIDPTKGMTKRQLKKYAELVDRPIAPTKFLHRDTLETLGLLEPVV